MPHDDKEYTQQEVNEAIALAYIKQAVDHIEQQVTDIHYVIHGNGDPGLKVRVDSIEKKQASHESLVRWGAGLIGTAAVGLAVYYIFGVQL